MGGKREKREGDRSYVCISYLDFVFRIRYFTFSVNFYYLVIPSSPGLFHFVGIIETLNVSLIINLKVGRNSVLRKS